MGDRKQQSLSLFSRWAATTGLLSACMLFIVVPTPAQTTLDVTFRYVMHPSENFLRVFVPGTMPAGSALDWGPNNNGFINPTAPSVMSFDPNKDAFLRTYPLDVGSEYQYKFHFHFNQNGTANQWLSDPRNGETTGSFQNSVVLISDPLLFQPALHEDSQGDVIGFSLGIFTNGNLETLTYLAGPDSGDGLPFLDGNGVFYLPIDPALSKLEHYRVVATIDGQDYVYDKPGATVVLAPRPVDSRLGANMTETGALFVVHAPEHPVMQVKLTPVDGAGDPEIVTLKKSLFEKDIWWEEVALAPGEYEYQYLLSNGFLVADPLSRRVRNGKSVIEVGPGGITTADDYVWASDGYTRPALDTLVIYELHVDDFAAKGSGQGKFTDVIARLEHLDSLGINAIELMPIMEFPGNRSWGYNTQHYAAVESTYGTPREFKQLVDAAHERGIAIILDIVWNHVDGNSPLWGLQPYYDKNPYFKTESEVRPNETVISFGGLLLDHFTFETQRYVREVHRIWIEEYRVDGFRFDFTRGIGWVPGQFTFGILAWSKALRDLDPTAYQIAEHLPADADLVNPYDLDAGWHDSFHDRLLNDIHKNPTPTMTTIEHQVLGLREYSNFGQQYSRPTGGVKATVTHDEQSLIQEMVAFDGVDLETALKRDLLYQTLTFTSLGVPMLWQAQELGMQSGWFDDNGNGNWDEEKLAYRPFDWSLLSSESGRRHLEITRKLIDLRKKNPAMYRGNQTILYSNNAERVIAYGYRDETPGHNGDAAMVVVNFASADQTIAALPWIATGDWTDAVHGGGAFSVSGDTLHDFSIPGYTASVFVKSVATAIRDPGDAPVSDFALLQNYPNPFNPATTLSYDVRERAMVSLTIYDVLGQAVRRLVAGVKAPGRYQVRWDGADDSGFPVASGIYIVRMSGGPFVATVKLLKMK